MIASLLTDLASGGGPGSKDLWRSGKACRSARAAEGSLVGLLNHGSSGNCSKVTRPKPDATDAIVSQDQVGASLSIYIYIYFFFVRSRRPGRISRCMWQTHLTVVKEIAIPPGSSTSTEIK